MLIYCSLVMKRIVDHNNSEDRPFLLGLPTGSTPLGMYKVGQVPGPFDFGLIPACAEIDSDT